MSNVESFVTSQAGDKAPQQTDNVWLNIPVIRRSDFTHDAFLDRYLNVHARLATRMLLAIGVSEYIQIHLPDLSTTTEEQLYATNTDEAAELRKIDAFGLLLYPVEQASKMGEALQHPYIVQVMIPDEWKFVHEELGLSPLAVRDPPYFKSPAWSAEEWRVWAKKVGGIEHTVIFNGQPTIEIGEEWEQKWAELGGDLKI